MIDIGELFEPLAESRDIRFEVRTERVDAVHGDRALLFEALTNLLDNALKYSASGGTVRLELRQRLQGPQIDVSDDGPGIAPDEREAVLQHRYRSRRTGHLAGSGLGLSIVSTVVNVHDFTLRRQRRARHARHDRMLVEVAGMRIARVAACHRGAC